MRISREIDVSRSRYRTLTTVTDTIPVSTLYGVGCYGALLMPQMDRRRMMLTTGIGVLAAALPVAEARARPPRPRR